MSAPLPGEKYSPPILPYPAASPKSVCCRATAPGALILTGMSPLAIRMTCPSFWFEARYHSTFVVSKLAAPGAESPQ